MRVWTNGTLHLARTPRGLYLFRGSQFVRRLDSPPLTPGDETLLAASPSGALAWLDGLRRVSLDEATIDEPTLDRDERLVDMAGLDETRVAVVLAAHKKRPARLALGVPGARWQMELSLEPSKPPSRADFPSGTAWSDTASVTWSDDAHSGATSPREVRLHAGPHGLAIACRRTGLVGVLRSGSDTIAWLRLPWQNEVSLDAVATDSGVLVTLVLPGGDGVTAHFSPEGACLGHSGSTRQSVGAVPLTGGRFVLFDDTRSQARVKVLDVNDCRDLHPRARLSLGSTPHDAASSPDGRWAIFGAQPAAASASVTIFELGDKRLAQVAVFDPDEAMRESEARAREKARIEQGAQYRRAEGAPSLGFPASKSPIVPWDGTTESTVDLSLSLRSTGGPGAGVIVELSGPALVEGIVEPLSVTVAGVTAKATRSPDGVWRVPLESIEIPRGMIFPFDPKPKSPEQSEKAQALLAATHLDLRLQLAPRRVGSALLTVAARTLSGSSAAMKWTRPVTVREPGAEPPAESPTEPPAG